MQRVYRRDCVLILLDALDQVQNVLVLNSVSNFITSKQAQHCRIVMTGRPTEVTNKRGNLLRGTIGDSRGLKVSMMTRCAIIWATTMSLH